jgi:TorA maturation chaperone TorD
MNHSELRTEVYLLLSEAFKKPSADFVSEQDDAVDFLRQALSELNYEIPEASYANWPDLIKDLPALEADYHRSFLFPLASRVVPVESIYRRWTYDATAEVPFAAEKGLLMSDHALHMTNLYAAYGLTIPAEYQSMPDHICLELEFAAFLLKNETPERFSQFLREHLNWVNELANDAEEQVIPTYYLQVIKITAQFLAKEMHRYSELKS